MLAEKLFLMTAKLTAWRVVAHDVFLQLLALEQRPQLRQEPAQKT